MFFLPETPTGSLTQCLTARQTAVKAQRNKLLLCRFHTGTGWSFLHLQTLHQQPRSQHLRTRSSFVAYAQKRVFFLLNVKIRCNLYTCANLRVSKQPLSLLCANRGVSKLESIKTSIKFVVCQSKSIKTFIKSVVCQSKSIKTFIKLMCANRTVSKR